MSDRAHIATKLAALLTMIVVCGSLHAGDPTRHFVDLDAVLDRAMEDDGEAGNGKGGWTDEGINDMYIFPAIPSGEVTRNGHDFRLDPQRRVLMLKGSKHHNSFAVAATVKMPPTTGRYLYVLHHSAGFQATADERVATYSILYEDGTRADREIAQNRDILHWWTGSWYENRGRASWPIFMGRNSYSRKWHRYIGVWAMQWENPQPEKAIVGLEFRSEGKSTPVIWAVTITDRDCHADGAALKADFVRPEEGDDAYFEPKLAIERQAIFALMQADGWAEGITGVEVIAPDLLAVTLDAAVAGGPGAGETAAAALQDAARFTITRTVGGVATVSQPTAVGRDTLRFWTGDIGRFPVCHIYHHTYYLRLGDAMKDGDVIRIAVAGLPEGTAKTAATLTRDSLANETRVLKVNQSGYAPMGGRRYAYIGWWAADLGTVDYTAFATAEIRDATKPERVVATVAIADRREADAVDEASGERVRQIDLAGVTEPGRYFVHVPGLGRSVDFELNQTTTMAAARTVMRGLLHQRCGCELTADSTDFPRPACHVQTYESSRLVGGINERYEDGKLVVQNPPVTDPDPIRSFAGGYHDAGDYDLFYYHFFATVDTLTAYEYGSDELRALDLNLPETSPLPDILDEAIWALKFYVDTQTPDGAVAAGRGNDEDYIRKNWPSEWGKAFGGLPAYGVLPPCLQSSAAFAGVAAQLARCLQATNPTLAADYRARAIRAYDWARTKPTTEYEMSGPSYIRIETPHLMLWATAELYKTTGETRFHDDFLAQNAAMDATKIAWRHSPRLPLYLWPYATASGPAVDTAIRETYREAILADARRRIASTENYGYRQSATRVAGGWGDLAGGGRNGLVLLRAWLLTGDRQFYDVASLNADFQLGANPLSRSYISGLGERAAIHPEVRDILYHGPHTPAPGIAVFGPGGGPKSLPDAYPEERPLWRCWMDNPVSAIHSEFVIERLGREAAFYLLLAGGKPIAP